LDVKSDTHILEIYCQINLTKENILQNQWTNSVTLSVVEMLFSLRRFSSRNALQIL